MSRSEQHLTDELLIGAIDDELTSDQLVPVEVHLSVCEDCRQKFAKLQAVSLRLESAVQASPVEIDHAQRAQLVAELEKVRELKPAVKRSESLLWRFGWSMGVAATIAVGVMLTAHAKHSTNGVTASAQYLNSGTFEIDGETFVALPYSNPDIPLSGPRIVEMQVPVSSLVDAGVIFEPVMNEVTGSNRSVLADVLLGTDGQPLGVHVLESE